MADQRARVLAFQAKVWHAQAEADDKLRRGLVQAIALMQQRIGFLNEREAIDANLFAKNMTTRSKVMDTKVAQEDMATEERQLDDIDPAATTRRIAGERELLDLDLKAPDAARQGTALLSLLPDDAPGSTEPALVAVLYVPASDGKKIAAGMTVEIKPSTVRRYEYGFIFGKVMSVAALPSTQEGIMRILANGELATALSANGAPFEIAVELTRDPRTPSGFRWSSGHGPATAIGPGTLARGQVWVHRQRLIEFAIPALHRLFGDDG